MVGEEVHDQTAIPQKNHLLVFGTGYEVAPNADNTQLLINRVRDANGLAFIAHPVDPAAPAFGEPDISWEKWNVGNYTGIELWNAMSEFKSLLKNKFMALFYAYNPKFVAHGPFPEALRKWDELMDKGARVVAIGGSDAHAFQVSMGPFHRILFPYEFHFRAVNTHIFTPGELSGEAGADQRMVLDAIRQGHAFIGYDLPSSTRGFRFTAKGINGTAWMGDEMGVRGGVTLQIRLPRRAECHLLMDGEVVKTWRKREICTYITSEAGVYRVEVYRNYIGRRRGWIFSNPIYLRD
jgi:hypothetical protein